MAEIWRHIFAPEAYVDVVSSVMLHPERAESTSSLWSEGSTEVSELSGSRKSGLGGESRDVKRAAESSPVMQDVDLQMEEVIRPRLEPTSKRRAVEVRSPAIEPARKTEKLLHVPSTPGDTGTPKSVTFSEVTDTIGVSDTLNRQFREDDLLRKKDFGKLKPREVEVEVIPAATSARAMSLEEFIAEESKPELAQEVEEPAEAAVIEDKLESEERERIEAERFFECKPQGTKVLTPSPAGEYSLTDLSSDIQEKLAKYIEPGPAGEPPPDLHEPALVGIQAPKKTKLRPIKFERPEGRPSFMAIPDVIKLNLPPLDESFNEVAVHVPTEKDEQLDIRIPVEAVMEATGKGEAARVPVVAEMGDVKVRVEAEAVPAQEAVAMEAPGAWKAVGETAGPLSRGAQAAGGVEIDIPFQNVFEALYEQAPAEEVKPSAPLREEVAGEQAAPVRPTATLAKGRKKTKRARKRERALQLGRGKPLLEEQPEIRVHEEERPEEKQSVIVVESAAGAKPLEERPVEAEEQPGLASVKPPSVGEAVEGPKTPSLIGVQRIKTGKLRPIKTKEADKQGVVEVKPRPSVVEIKVLPRGKEGTVQVPAAGLEKPTTEVPEGPKVLTKSQGPSEEWTAVGDASVKGLGEREAKTLEIVVPVENVFETLAGQEEPVQEAVVLPTPIAPRGQPHKTERGKRPKAPSSAELARQSKLVAESDQREKELRKSIIISPASPLTVRTGEQLIVLKSIPSSAGPAGETVGPQMATEPETLAIAAAEAERIREVEHAKQVPEAGFPESARAAENQRVIDAVHNDIQRFKNELVGHMTQLDNNMESRNDELSQQLTNVLDQLAQLQKSLKEPRGEYPLAEGVRRPVAAERLAKKPKAARTKKGVPVSARRITPKDRYEMVATKSSKPVELTPPSQPTEPSVSSLYSEQIGLCNPPSVNLDYFEPALFQEIAKLKPSPQPAKTPTESPFSSIYGEQIGLCNPPSVNLDYFEPALFATPELEPSLSRTGESAQMVAQTKDLEESAQISSQARPSVDFVSSESSLLALKKPAEKERVTQPSQDTARFEPPVRAVVEQPPGGVKRHPSVDLAYFEPSMFASPAGKPIRKETRQRHPSVDLTFFEPSMFASPKGKLALKDTRQRHPSVDLTFFEPSMFASPKGKPALKDTRQRHPSVDLTFFEPSMFASPKVTAKPESRPRPIEQKEPKAQDEPSLLSSLAKGIQQLVSGPPEPQVSTGIRQPSVDLQYFEPKLFVPSPARHPSVDLQYFEPSMFESPEGKAATKEARGRHPSVNLSPFEPSLFATPVPTTKPSALAAQRPPKRVAKSGLVGTRVKAIEQKTVSPITQAPPTVARAQIKAEKRHPSVDLQYFDPSLFSLPETTELDQVVTKKKKRNWLRKIVDKLFKHKEDEQSLARKRAKKEAKAAKKAAAKEAKEQEKIEKRSRKAAKRADKLARKEVKASKPSETVQLESIHAPLPVTHPSVDLTFFEPALFATPVSKPSTGHKLPSEPKGVVPIAMASPPQEPYTHFARPVVMQQPAQPPPSHESNVQRLRQPSKVAQGRPSVDLQFFEPSLFEETPEFKRPLAKEKSPFLEGLDEMSVPEAESVWSVLLAGTDTPDLRQQARELVLSGSGIPENMRPSLWLTLSGGAPKHTICYRRLSRQSEPIKDSLYAMTKRLSSALDSYYKSLSGHSFDYSLESLVIQLITRTVQLPDPGLPLDSAILYQEEQTFALALNLLYGQDYRLAAVFTKHGLREWCYELDRVLEHEDNVVHPPSLTFAAPWFQGLFFNAVNDDEAGLILDWFILEGRSVLFRLAVAMESNRGGLFEIASDLRHITNTQLDSLHNYFESAWEQRRLQLHHEHKERSEVDHELAVLTSLSQFERELQKLYHSHHQLRSKLDHERDQKAMLEHANENLMYMLHDRNASRPHL